MYCYRTIIIDDETIARDRLKRLLANYGTRFHLIGEAQNGIEGVELINNLKPDLIFLDIQMPGKTGFEMLQELTNLPKVVFCTAFEEFALQAFNTLAIDYLLKPVEMERLHLTLEKLDQNPIGNPGLQINELIELVKQKKDDKKLQSIPHKIGDRILLIKTENICYFSATEKYVEFYTTEGKKYLTEMSLKRLSERLPNNFVQIQRGTIVNLNLVKEYRKYFRGKYILVLDDISFTKLETGRSYTNSIKDLLSVE
jgi:two-component system LytT family response regulator